MEQASPLQWPQGRQRTDPRRIIFSRFQSTEGVARSVMTDEIGRMGGRNIIISTNKPTRRDGLPYASAKEPEDSGVAVYFERKGTRVCFACDQYHYIWENMKAIAKTIEAMRGIERWGSAEMLDQAFVGFKALPPPTDASVDWWLVLGVSPSASDSEIQIAYKGKARVHSGTPQMVEINVARDAGLK